jgi:hypothetical protein
MIIGRTAYDEAERVTEEANRRTIEEAREKTEQTATPGVEAVQPINDSLPPRHSVTYIIDACAPARNCAGHAQKQWPTPTGSSRDTRLLAANCGDGALVREPTFLERREKGEASGLRGGIRHSRSSFGGDCDRPNAIVSGRFL